MDRRLILKAAAVLPFAASSLPGARRPAEAPATLPPPAGWRRFELTTRITLSDPASPADLWVPLAQTLGDYQQAEAPRWTTDGQASPSSAMNATARRCCAWAGGRGRDRTLRIFQAVATRERSAERSWPSAGRSTFWTQPSESLQPTASCARRRAGHSRNQGRPARLRRLDWVVDHTFRDPATRGSASATSAALLGAGGSAGSAPTSTG